MASTADGIVYPIASDFIAPLNTHLQSLAESVQDAIDTKVSYTPTFTGLSLGNGTVAATYVKNGGVVVDEIIITLGSSSAISGEVYINGLPVESSNGSQWMQQGTANLYDNAGTSYLGVALQNTTTSLRILAQGASGTFVTWYGLSATAPFTWGAGDKIMVRTVRIAA